LHLIDAQFAPKKHRCHSWAVGSDPAYISNEYKQAVRGRR